LTAESTVSSDALAKLVLEIEQLIGESGGVRKT
jgi:hypothetical protein